MKNDERLEQIMDLILQYTKGNFYVRGKTSEKGDELDAIIIGLNTMAEEFEAVKISYANNVRINNIIDVLLKTTQFDFSDRIPLSDRGDELDAIAVGVNTLIEEMETHIHELEDREEKIKMANQELEAFSYSVSHDLRSPIRAINGFTKIIMDKYLDKFDEDGKELINIINNEAKRMGQLIDDLLAFSRLGRKDIERADVNMVDLANEVIREVLSLSEVKYTAQIQVHELPTAKCDGALIKQVFVNLINNALKFSHPKKDAKIEIGSFDKDNKTVYYVKDNGVGFDMKYYDKLFGVFQRLHSAEDFAGTGIGLADRKSVV